MNDVDALRAAFARPEPPRSALPPGAASVLAPLVPTERGVHVLLERRPPGGSPFAGQLSFPGGRLEPRDATPLVGALREAYEEVGLRPQEIEVLGHLADLDSHLGQRVVAYAGLVPLSAVPPTPASPAEVEELLLVPLRALREPGTPAEPLPASRPPVYRAERYESRLFGGRAYTMHYWHLVSVRGGSRAVLWGLTAEMLNRLMHRAFGWSPPGRPRVVERPEDILP